MNPGMKNRVNHAHKSKGIVFSSYGFVNFPAGREVRLAVLSKGDFFGEMAIFDHEVRSATVRTMGEVRALTIDKRTFLRRITEDPSIAFRIVERMSRRIRELDAEVVRLKTGD